MKELKPPFEWKQTPHGHRLGIQGDGEPLRFYSREDANFLARKAGLERSEAHKDYDYRTVIYNGMVCWHVEANVEAKETNG